MRYVLAVALLVAWFGTLGLRPLYKADESRYAEIPREMVASGDWITPRLNGFKYFEKPPLQYWTTAAFFSVLGEKDWVARLWTALTGLAGLVATWFFTRRILDRKTAWYAAAVLAGCPLYVLLAQVNTLDMGLTLFLSSAIFAFALGHMLLFWAACALAVLSKGLIGIVLPLGTVFLYMLVRRDWSIVKRIRPIAGPALFLLIAAPWFIAVSAANAEFAHFFFIQEHFERFTTRMHGRYQPAWYFIPILAFGVAPWLAPLVFSFRDIRNEKLLLALWVIVVFAFFSLSGSKLPSYILPLFPALAVLIAASLPAVSRPTLLVQALLTIAAGVTAAAFAPRLAAGYQAYVPWMAAASALAAGCGLVVFFFALRQRVPAAVATLAFAGAACTLVALAGHAVLAPQFSVAGLVAAAPRIAPGTPVYAVDAYDHSIPWYLRRTVTMVAYKDELDKAIAWERARFVPDLRAFADAWSLQPQAYAFVSTRDFERLKATVPMQALARDPRYVLVRKP